MPIQLLLYKLSLAESYKRYVAFLCGKRIFCPVEVGLMTDEQKLVLAFQAMDERRKQEVLKYLTALAALFPS